MKNIFYLLILAGFIQLISCSASEKTTQAEGPVGMKQKQFSSEQIEADALAMADISCQWEVANYNAGLQENNRKLNLKEKELYDLKFAFEQKMKIRYLQIEELKKKYNKALETAYKRLNACEKRDVIREMEKAKAEGGEK